MEPARRITQIFDGSRTSTVHCCRSRKKATSRAGSFHLHVGSFVAGGEIDGAFYLAATAMLSTNDVTSSSQCNQQMSSQ